MLHVHVHVYTCETVHCISSCLFSLTCFTVNTDVLVHEIMGSCTCTCTS